MVPSRIRKLRGGHSSRRSVSAQCGRLSWPRSAPAVDGLRVTSGQPYTRRAGAWSVLGKIKDGNCPNARPVTDPASAESPGNGMEIKFQTVLYQAARSGFVARPGAIIVGATCAGPGEVIRPVGQGKTRPKRHARPIQNCGKVEKADADIVIFSRPRWAISQTPHRAERRVLGIPTAERNCTGFQYLASTLTNHGGFRPHSPRQCSQCDAPGAGPFRGVEAAGHPMGPNRECQVAESKAVESHTIERASAKAASFSQMSTQRVGRPT